MYSLSSEVVDEQGKLNSQQEEGKHFFYCFRKEDTPKWKGLMEGRGSSISHWYPMWQWFQAGNYFGTKWLSSMGPGCHIWRSLAENNPRRPKQPIDTPHARIGTKGADRHAGMSRAACREGDKVGWGRDICARGVAMCLVSGDVDWCRRDRDAVVVPAEQRK
ncbi:hypothetical protein BD410DRAFT_805687 [Rickenella mellea]|uniref:Uncharacterized protein n=1 Tax=Rickenella mellea TaxID=50990 RepID=A0A4Y7PYH3_9AGAM|nr:hypothetical protein BD410DRAFT_805687 [Rickenella mellea]